MVDKKICVIGLSEKDIDKIALNSDSAPARIIKALKFCDSDKIIAIAKHRIAENSSLTMYNVFEVKMKNGEYKFERVDEICGRSELMIYLKRFVISDNRI